ncbi:MAG: hypothetical protein HYW04_03765 [Deltaproteobacteria bacterium]|nr:hypothetical protein [Deltaproteobacteria bacterium]
MQLNEIGNVQELYEHIQSLPLKDRLELLSRILADVKAHVELREELEDWDKLSDEALAAFENKL